MKTADGQLARIFHSRWVARATCTCRRATSPAEARRQTSRAVSLRHDKVLVHAWPASCRPEQAGSLFHPSGGKQYEIFGLARLPRGIDAGHCLGKPTALPGDSRSSTISGEFLALIILSESLRYRSLCVWSFNA